MTLQLYLPDKIDYYEIPCGKALQYKKMEKNGTKILIRKRKTNVH